MPGSISVVIPYYRRQDTFAEALQSVLDQTLAPREILVVDDGSGTDDVRFLEQFVPAIRVISLPVNGGVSRARNAGVEKAGGDFIAFLDSDDTWHPDKLARQLDYLQANPECDAVHTGVTVRFPDGSTQSYMDKPLTLTTSDLVRSSHVICQSLLMKKSDFVRLGGFDPGFRQTEDYEFSMRMVVNGLRVDFLSEPLVTLQRGRGDHLSSNWWGYLVGHLRVVWRYSSVFREAETVSAPSSILADT